MKQFVLTLIAVLIGGFLALLGYDRFIVQPREAAATKAEAAAKAQTAPANPQVDLGRARAEAQQVADEVEASVQRSVDGARQTMDAQAKLMDRRALIAEAASRATMFRVSLTEYYQSNGRWPRDADEAGLPAPTEMRGGAVREIRLGEQGVVTVKMDERFPEGSAIVLRPAANAASGMVDWTCEVKGDELKQSLPRCKG
ncbi:MAG: pilin [Xanthomonadales bacterium]|nr:pilin [Xanthomonadales bacterium]